MPSSLQDLTTESHNPLSRDLDRLSSFEIARLMNQEDALVATAVRDELPAIARAIDLAASTLAAGGRVVYVGAGTSGRLGMLDASEWQPTFGVDPDVVRVILAGGPQAAFSPVEDAEDDEQEGYRRVRETVRSGDLVVGLTASGRTPFVMGALRAARDVGARTVSIACNRPSPIEALADVAIAPVVGPEVLAGSTRLKAGTAQKMVLNMISTGAMVRLGKVYRNLMVDMRATNEKLRRRALRMVMAATGCSEEQALDALARAGMHVKTAIVMLLAGVGVEEARARLAAAGGFVRRAVRERDA
ncbi:MAG TPA: N-acetylmuramic acid 6-phosphate etherase [Limnochordales bacterium]